MYIWCRQNQHAGCQEVDGLTTANGFAGKSLDAERRRFASVMKCLPKIHVKRSVLVVADTGAWITNLVRELDGQALVTEAAGDSSRSRKGPSREGDSIKATSVRQTKDLRHDIALRHQWRPRSCCMRHSVGRRSPWQRMASLPLACHAKYFSAKPHEYLHALFCRIGSAGE